MNGTKERDEEGKMTFTERRRETVIDYFIGGQKSMEKGGKNENRGKSSL